MLARASARTHALAACPRATLVPARSLSWSHKERRDASVRWRTYSRRALRYLITLRVVIAKVPRSARAIQRSPFPRDDTAAELDGRQPESVRETPQAKRRGVDRSARGSASRAQPRMTACDIRAKAFGGRDGGARPRNAAATVGEPATVHRRGSLCYDIAKRDIPGMEAGYALAPRAFRSQTTTLRFSCPYPTPPLTITSSPPCPRSSASESIRTWN